MIAVLTILLPLGLVLVPSAYLYPFAKQYSNYSRLEWFLVSFTTYMILQVLWVLYLATQLLAK